jgi:hypothetical protein
MQMLLPPVILIALVLFVAWPLLKDRPETESLEEASELDLALEEKESAIANLKDIEMDYRMGKLSEDDYTRLKAEWETTAVGALQKVESLSKQKRPSRRS